MSKFYVVTLYGEDETSAVVELNEEELKTINKMIDCFQHPAHYSEVSPAIDISVRGFDTYELAESYVKSCE